MGESRGMRILGRRRGKRELPFVKEIKMISDDITVVRLAGAIDLAAMPPVERAMRKNRSHLDQNIVLDFTEVTHIDTATLAVLIYVLNRLKKRHKKLCLMWINDTVREHIRIAKLEPIIHVFDTLEDVVATLSK